MTITRFDFDKDHQGRDVCRVEFTAADAATALSILGKIHLLLGAQGLPLAESPAAETPASTPAQPAKAPRARAASAPAAEAPKQETSQTAPAAQEAPKQEPVAQVAEPAVERRVQPARQEAAPVSQVQQAPAAQPAAGGAPAELVQAASFRQVMSWMLAHGFKTPEAIEAKCAEFRDQVPTLSRLGGDITDRIKRALQAMLPEAQQAN